MVWRNAVSEAREAGERSRLVELALRPESRPKARRPPTRVGARGAELRRTEFELQGQPLCGGRAAGRAPRTLRATRVGSERAIPFSFPQQWLPTPAAGRVCRG